MTILDELYNALKNKFSLVVKDVAKSKITVVVSEWNCDIKIYTNYNLITIYRLGSDGPENYAFDGTINSCIEKIENILESFFNEKNYYQKIELLKKHNTKPNSIFLDNSPITFRETSNEFHVSLITHLRKKFESVGFDSYGHVVIMFPAWKTQITVSLERKRIYYDIFLKHYSEDKLVCIQRELYDFENITDCRETINDIVKKWKQFVWKVREPYEIKDHQFSGDNNAFEKLWSIKERLDKEFWPLKGNAERQVLIPTIDELFIAIKNRFPQTKYSLLSSIDVEVSNKVSFFVYPSRKGIVKLFNFISDDDGGTCDSKYILYDGSIEDCLRILGAR